MNNSSNTNFSSRIDFVSKAQFDNLHKSLAAKRVVESKALDKKYQKVMKFTLMGKIFL